MSEDRTGETKDSRSFEERVFTRFDLLDERFGRELSDVTIRIGKLEERQFDTKPIWERALAAIVEIHDELKAINSRLNGMDQRFDVMNKSFAVIDARFDKQDIDAEDNVRGLERKLDVLNKDILELRADQRYVDSRLEKIESQAKPS
jgi:uncharacterized protein YhaN